MKIFTLILTVGSLFSIASHAQSPYSLSGSGPKVVTCNFSKSFSPSEKLAELTKSKNLVAHCSGNGQTYEIAFVGVNFTANEEFHKQAIISLRCSGDDTSGIYAFGGYPIGFATQSSSKSPWFYKTEGSGKCSVEYNAAAITSVQAVKNKSAMVLLEVGTLE